MRPRICRIELNVVSKTLLQFQVQRVVRRIAVGQLRVNIRIRIQRTRRAESSSELRIEEGFVYETAASGSDKEVVRTQTAEIVGCDRAHDSQAGGIVHDDQ